MPRRRTPPVAGRYVLLEEIGRGATGSVHRARDLRRGRYVAAKVLSPGVLDPTMLVLRYAREQSLRIDHPHVLTVSGWAAEDETVLLAMDLVRGGSVRELLGTHGPLPERCVAVLLGHLLEALAVVHSRGVVHGDVKPANLLLEATGSRRPHLRLADFGVATRLDDTVRLVTSGPVGTPAYLPPELEAGAPPHKGQDVYAAGVVARRLLDGSGPLLTLVDSMTRPEPALRPTAAAALRRLRELPPAAPGPWPEVPDRLDALSRPA